MQKNLVLRLARFAVTAVLIVYVLKKSGLFSFEGWQNLFETFAQISLTFLLASIGIGLLVTLSSAFKWYMLLRSRGLAVSLWRLYAYYMIGMFFNLILPTSLGGDVVRMHELGQYTGRRADAVASVFVERFSGMVTLVVLAFLAIVVNIRMFNYPWLTVALGIVVLGVMFIIWLIIDERPFRLAQQVVNTRVPLLYSFFAKIEKFQQAVLAYKSDSVALWGALINSLIFYFLAIVNVWVSARAFGANLSFMSMIIAVPVILLIMNLPISIGGIGLMEFAYSFTLGLFGVAPALAISTALLMRAKSFVYAGVGGLFYPLVSGGQSPSAKIITHETTEHADTESILMKESTT